MSPRASLVLVCILVPAFLFGLNKALCPNHHRRNYELFYEMVNSVAYESYADNPVFPDGKTLQLPPEGTIARGALPLEDPDNAANPFPAGDAAVLARGAEVFANQCVVCHGAQGAGDGPVVKRGVPAPPAFTRTGLSKLSDAQIYRLITEGRGNMPPYGPHVLRADRWKLIHYIRAMAGERP